MDVEKYLRRQAGVIGLRQALVAGMSRSAVHRRVSSGQWRALYPGVYLVAGHVITDEVRIRAAVLWAGDGAVVHGVSAAWWHEIWLKAPRSVTVTVPRRRRIKSRPGVLVRQRDLDDLDETQRRDLPVTGLALTVLEAAVALGPDGAALMDRALQTCVEFDWLVLAQHRGFGRYGSPAAGALLTAAADRAASAAERRLTALLRGAGITGWVLGHRCGGFEIDLAFPAVRVAVEVDGWAWHSTPERFVRDRQRQNALVNAGWRVLRFTWHDLTARPGPIGCSPTSGRRSRPAPHIDRDFARSKPAHRHSIARNRDHRFLSGSHTRPVPQRLAHSTGSQRLTVRRLVGRPRRCGRAPEPRCRSRAG